MSCTSATHPAITGRLFQGALRQWSMGRDGITHPTLVPRCGTAGRTPTVWEPDSPTPASADGVSASDMDMVTIRTTTRGGGRWGTTVAAGIRITAGARGAGLPLPTCTECGATPRIRERARPGRIRTPETTERPRAVLTTILRPAGPRWRDAAPTPISTPAIPQATGAERRITRTRESSPAAGRATLATFTAGKARRTAVASSTTPTRTRE